MPTSDKSLRVSELELEILRKLCDPHATAAAEQQTYARAHHRILSEVQAHKWQDAEHRIVFEAMARLPGRNADELRRQLPAQATRMGFPDVQWETYFTGDLANKAGRADPVSRTLEALIAQLRALSPETAS